MTGGATMAPRLPATKTVSDSDDSKSYALYAVTVAKQWSSIVTAATQDQRLRRGVPTYFEHPTQYISEVSIPPIYLKDLTPESQWMCLRLRYLMKAVIGRTSTYGDSATVNELSGLLTRSHQWLEWDAYHDIALADQLISEGAYATSNKKSRLPWKGIREVIDLRSRIVYLVEILALLHDILLRNEAAERLHRSDMNVRQLQEARTWLQTYVGKLAELEAPQAQVATRKSLWSRLTSWDE